MIQETLFVFVTIVSCIALFGTLFSFTVFLSSQEIKENDKGWCTDCAVKPISLLLTIVLLDYMSNQALLPLLDALW